MEKTRKLFKMKSHYCIFRIEINGILSVSANAYNVISKEIANIIEKNIK
jgi:hypothetical protein